MNSFKKFYLDFVFMYGTIWLISTIFIISAKLYIGLTEFLGIIAVSLLYAIVKLFWDNYNTEKIESLENEVEQLKAELAKKTIETN